MPGTNEASIMNQNVTFLYADFGNCGEVHPGSAPLQALHCALCSTEQSAFQGGEKRKNVPRKGEEEGWPANGAKRRKGRVKTGRECDWVAVPLSPCVSCGIADYRCYTPTSFRKSCLSQHTRTGLGGGGGGTAEKTCP